MSKKTYSEINNINQSLISTLKNIPSEPGCYLMKDKEDRLLYIGKSKNLKSRVRSYFSSGEDLSPRISLMVRQINSIDFIVTDTESEALTLESNLIKSQQPYFNVLLKDDKKYPYVCITWSEEYPRIFITRRRRDRKRKDRYYGPFVDVNLLRKTLFTIKRLFPLRQRSIPLYKDRTCLNYSIGRCPGVCQKIISSEDYIKVLKRVEMIFQGRTTELERLLEEQMFKLSDSMQYEQASMVRDQITGISRLYESQKMIIPDSSICRDVIAMSSDSSICSIQIFQMRAGKLVGKLGYISPKYELDSPTILQKTIEEHYSNVEPVEIPPEILVQFSLPQQELICKWLTEIKKVTVKIKNPVRSKKAELIKLVEKNAVYELESIRIGNDKQKAALEDLCLILDLKDIPRRIEGFDISHIQGSDPVASQVVFIDGIPAKHHYRKYNIKSEQIQVGHSDDYLSMSEVISRRFRRWSRIKSQQGSLQPILDKKKSIFDPAMSKDWPDLVVIDGGKGQLSTVLNTLRDLNLEDDINIIALAKKREEIFVPGLKSPLETEKNQPGLFLLRRLRDESHRFAVTFHRKKRSLRMKRSQLSEIPGLGPKRIKLLLSHFRSIDAIQMASVKELCSTPGLGMNSAEIIWNYFHPSENQ